MKIEIYARVPTTVRGHDTGMQSRDLQTFCKVRELSGKRLTCAAVICLLLPAMVRAQGTVNSGTARDLATYPATGTTVGDSGIAADNMATLNGNNGFAGDVISTKMNNTIYVDGVNYPATTAGINAAIEALPSAPQGGTIYLPQGTTTMNGVITIDRPVHLIGSVGGSFNGIGTVLSYTGSGVGIAVNGTAGAASGTILEGFELQNNGAGTVGIDVYNGQYDVTIQNVTVEDSASTPFSVAGIRLGNNTSGSATINAHLRHVRLANQVIGLDSLFVNEATCEDCAIYGGTTANVQVGDSTHLTTNLNFYGGNIEMDSGTVPSVNVLKVEGLGFYGVYVETTGGNWLSVPNTATTAHGIRVFGGRFQGNTIIANIFALNFSGAELSIRGAYSTGYPATSNWVSNTSSLRVWLDDISSSDTNISFLTGSTTGVSYGVSNAGSSIISPLFPGLTLQNGPTAGGAAAGLTGTGACATITTQSGGSWAGKATCMGTTAPSTFTIKPGTTAPTGWSCSASDITTANALRQSAVTATTCTIAGTVNTNDVITWTAIAY